MQGPASACAKSFTQRLRSDANGAIMIIVAVFAGAGVLLAVLAMGIETGRVYLMRSQVQSAGDSTILALAQQCKNNVLGVTTKCTSATSLFSLAKTSAAAVSSGQNAITLVGVCVDTGTATTLRCATSASGPDSSVPGALNARCAPLPANTESYVQVIVERTTAFTGLFLPTTKFQQCVQAKWVSGITKSIPNPFVFPGCFYVAGGLLTLYEDPGNGGGNRNSGPCTNTTANSLFGTMNDAENDPSGNLTGIQGTSTECGAPGSVTLPVTLSTGANLGGNTGACRNNTTTYPAIVSWLSSTANANWVAVAGDFVNAAKSDWNVRIVAFAKFDLYAFNDGYNTTWTKRGASGVGGTWPTGVADPTGCGAPAKTVCLYGRWITGELVTAGSGTTEGIELLQ